MTCGALRYLLGAKRAAVLPMARQLVVLVGLETALAYPFILG